MLRIFTLNHQGLHIDKMIKPLMKELKNCNSKSHPLYRLAADN